MNNPATFNTGSRRPRFLNSMPNRMVAADWRKNSTPPVASSWLIGAAPSSGAMTRTCSITPSAPTATILIAAASTIGAW